MTSEITPAHVEKLLVHWADEHARIWADYEAWQRSQAGGLAGQVVDRSREGAAKRLLTGSARARVARMLIVKAMRDRGELSHVPAWAGGDPTRCKETRGGGVPRWSMDAVAEQVDAWVTALWLWDPRAAMCLQAHYRQGMRVGEGHRWVAYVTELRMNRHGYIAGLARGRLNIRQRAEESVKIGA